MAGKNTAAFGIYSNRATAEAAVDKFVAGGFSNQDVSVLMSDNQGSRDFAAEKNTKAPEGAATGVGVGGTVGGTLGLLAGIGALAIPGVGPLIAAGPIMGALAGLGIGGAVGGLVGALVGLGIPEYEAKRYEGRVKDGGILISIHCDSSEEVSRAKDILKATGAEDISSSGEKAVSSHGVDSGQVDTKLDRGVVVDREKVIR
ncbi:Succinyl-CoA ligase [ADP-forming] beta chain (plasmid) [Acidisarcina polymorpha]|uniref:Succinyl-CoA ligase [ADP-forming] beta chain n=1 Tax=Acidisarcina polymorpha TaxID=2211140 RepID=A0A2Z5GBI6_9BACT|nr:general stress protein [Acidisarcina polymorpha]AXC16300.1 Succinyl-CoA ligase [ADP-forming] beta chain [Acidisarcina polymorpha]